MWPHDHLFHTVEGKDVGGRLECTMKLEKHIQKSFFFFGVCILLCPCVLPTFRGDIGNHTRSLCLSVACGRATHVVFLRGGELFPLIPRCRVCRYFETSPKSVSSERHASKKCARVVSLLKPVCSQLPKCCFYLIFKSPV